STRRRPRRASEATRSRRACSRPRPDLLARKRCAVRRRADDPSRQSPGHGILLRPPDVATGARLEIDLPLPAEMGAGFSARDRLGGQITGAPTRELDLHVREAFT